MVNSTRYTIMHMDRKVASVRGDGTCTIYTKKFMPYNLYLEEDDDIDTRLNNLTNFYYWCSSRILSLDRKYAKEILNSLNMRQVVTDRERAEIAIAYHGVSLTDVFWIKGNREKISFDTINLFCNFLSNAFVDVSLRGKHLTVNNEHLVTDSEVAGDISVMGVAPKAWVRENNTFLLYKDGDIRDVEAELLASKIARCFDVDQVLYEERMYDGEKVSISNIITDINRSIVTAEYVEIYLMNRDIDLYDYVMTHDSYSFHMMNIIDYLVGNTDRHWGNWGYFVDNMTNSLVKLHSLMDFNKSFLAYDSIEGAFCQTFPGHVSQRFAAETAVKTIGLNQISEINYDWFSDDEIRKMFEKRLELLKAIQRC